MVPKNVVGYVLEFLDDQIEGQTKVRFRIQVKNTMGQEKVLWAVLEDPGLTQEVSDFYSSQYVPTGL